MSLRRPAYVFLVIATLAACTATGTGTPKPSASLASASASNLAGQWRSGTAQEPAAGPVLPACDRPRNENWNVEQTGTSVTFYRYQPAGEVLRPDLELHGAVATGHLSLSGPRRVVATPGASAAAAASPAASPSTGPAAMELDFDAKTQHLRGTLDGEAIWLAPVRGTADCGA